MRRTRWLKKDTFVGVVFSNKKEGRNRVGAKVDNTTDVGNCRQVLCEVGEW